MAELTCENIESMIQKLIGRAEKEPAVLPDAFQLCRKLETMPDTYESEEKMAHTHNFYRAHELNKQIRKLSAKIVKETGSRDMLELNSKTLLFDAPWDFDCFCRYLEWNRPYDKKFYEPRRRMLYQLTQELQRLEDGELDLLAISLPPGVGKALANDTPVFTQTGWKKHGELVVGDKVLSPDGVFVPIYHVGEKCKMEYEVSFSNGEKIICHGNHIWTIYNRHNHKVEQRATNTLLAGIETEGIVGRGHRYHYQLLNRMPLMSKPAELPVKPYTFGVWLGDGANKNPRICNAKCDTAIIKSIINDDGYNVRWQTEHKDTHVMYYDFNIRKELQSMNLCHSRKIRPKYIPHQYMVASLEQRLELLAGLIDTDGCLLKGRRDYQFTTAEESLRDSFVQFISTFGWRCTVIECKPTTSSSGIKSRNGHWNIKFKPAIPIPCRLERKRLPDDNFTPQRMIAITGIKPIETDIEGNCISVIGEEYCVGHTMIPTHNTTLAIFYLAWIAGKHPEKPILGGSHSNSFLRGVYDEFQRVLDPEGEYLWGNVFPEYRIIKTNAKDMHIDVGHSEKNAKRFATLQLTSIGSGNAGKVRAQQLLYCDDLVDGIEAALSKERMDKLWSMYVTDLRQRKIGRCRELHIATRWSVHDVIGRLAVAYEGDARARFVAIPAMDENDESNFDYGNAAGFTTAFYREQREIMDDASWRALYMNEPIEREGVLYNEDELRRFYDLPDREPDAVLAVCDTKDRGVDYCVMPIAYQYGNDFYLVDIICDNSNPDVVEERIVEKLIDHRVGMARFESNAAGGRIAEWVQDEVKRRNGITRITTKYTMANKETRIIIAAGWVKEHLLFQADSYVKKNKEYRTALNFLCGYTMMGKNKHDDVPDAISMFADLIQSFSMGRAEIIRRPF